MFGIDDAIAAGLKILDKFVPDPAAKAEAEAALRTALLDWDKSQMAVNAAEAGSGDWFSRRWRPFIGWVCGLAFAYHYILQPFLLFLFAVFGVAIKLPAFDMMTLSGVLFGMLGLGGLRTYEKTRNGKS